MTSEVVFRLHFSENYFSGGARLLRKIASTSKKQDNSER